MAEFTQQITEPIADLDDLADLLKFWNNKVCKKQEKGKSFIFSVVLGTKGKDAGKNLVWYKDSTIEPTVPLVREFPVKMPEEERLKVIAAMEKAEALKLRSTAIVRFEDDEKWVVFFDSVVAPQKPPSAKKKTSPALKSEESVAIGKITKDHWLDTAIRKVIGSGDEFQPQFLVIHYTEGYSAEGSISGWEKAKNGILAHVVVDRDGRIFQCRPFNQICLHAGTSRIQHPETGKVVKGLNSSSIGIEIANTGDGGDDDLHQRLPKLFPSAKLMTAPHRNVKISGSNAKDHQRKQWELFPRAQLDAVFGLTKLLLAKYSLVEITGHDCIAFERKTDPGPAFPMEQLRSENGFEGLPSVWNTNGEPFDV
jgi:N-acetylmuramoyl-L-alanine amidase